MEFNLYPYDCKIVSNKHWVECLEGKTSGLFNADINLDVNDKIMSISIISELVPWGGVCENNILKNTVHKCKCEYAIYIYDTVNKELITNILTEILYLQYTINSEYIHEKYISKVTHISMAALHTNIQSLINISFPSSININLFIPANRDR